MFGAVWGAAVLVLLPMWSTDLAHSFSFSTNVSNNLPLAIYGVVLIAAMLAWPSGIQGAVRVIGSHLTGNLLMDGTAPCSQQSQPGKPREGDERSTRQHPDLPQHEEEVR